MTQHSDDWLNPTREMLKHWARHLNSIKGNRMGYSSKAAHLSERCEDAPIPEDSTADKVDRILCQVRVINAELYDVLSMYYFHRYSDGAISEALKKSREKCRVLRHSGEVMVATMIHNEKTKIKITP